MSSVLYEYPFNERIRTLLRLEDLFEKLTFFLQNAHPLQHHVALNTLFEILDVASRADLKSDLLQELERQRTTLETLRENPHVAQERLLEVLTEIGRASSAFSATSGKAGHHLRDSEWLMSLRSRTIIPGGACEFDLPAYHAWQHRSPEARLKDLGQWIEPFAPLHRSLVVALRLLRESGRGEKAVATRGQYQQMLGGRQFHLIQMRLSAAPDVFPEISANKHMVSVRFSQLGADLKSRPYEDDVDFELSLCSF